MDRLSVVALGLMVLAAFPAAGVTVGVTFSESAAQDVVKARSEAMNKMGAALGKIAKVARGEAEYSPALVEDANVIKATSEVLVTIFPEGSVGGLAKPEIWSDRNGFKRNAAALKACLDSLTPVARPNRPHDVALIFRWRRLAGVWQWLFFENARFRPDPTRDARWNRGAYLVEALTHCAECHTPRNRFGALDRDRWMAGTLEGPDGRPAPNITPHPGTGIGAWSESDLVYLMKTGLKPNFDNVQGTMAETVEHGLSHPRDKNLQAIAVYILSLPPVDNPIASP